MALPVADGVGLDAGDFCKLGAGEAGLVAGLATAVVGRSALAMAEGCACRGTLDTCVYCALVRGQEALERLVTGDPFVGGVDGVEEEGEWVRVIG